MASPRFGDGDYAANVRDRFTYGFPEWARNENLVPMIAADGAYWGVWRSDVNEAIKKRGLRPDYVQVTFPDIGIVTFAHTSPEEMNRKCAQLRRAYFRMVWQAYILIYIVFGTNRKGRSAAT